MRVLQDEPEAEDVATETMTKVWNNAKDLIDHLSPRQWIFRTARNRILDLLRAKQRRRKIVVDEALEADEPTALIVDDPLAELIRKDRKNILDAALKQLPEREREIVALQWLGDMEVKAIAEELDLTVTNVTTISHRARRQLKGILIRLAAEGIHK